MNQELTKAAQQALEACPFCGGDAEYVSVGDRGYVRISCKNAVSCGHHGSAMPRAADAAQAWNTRAGTEMETSSGPSLHWRCFHCNYIARSHAEALAHFGPGISERPASCLTQRPAAQTEREAFEEWFDDYYDKACAEFGGIDCTDPKGIAEDAWQARASLPAPQQATPDHVPDAGKMVQATPEPVALGPLAQRNIYDAIRSAYDLGYNDARNARTVPGDSAPGYKGRDVEADHGGALINTLASRLRSAATPEPVQLDVVRQAIEDRDAMESRYHDLAHNLTYQGNSVAWWHSKATAYRNAIDEVWSALKVAGIRADGTKTCADGVRELAATPEPVGEPALWVLTSQLKARETTHRGYLWFDNPQNVLWTPLYTRPAAAPAVPEDSALLDYLDTLAARPAGSDLHCFGGRVVLYVRTGIGSQIEASGAGAAREAIRAAMLSAAQAKGDQA